MSDMWDSVAPGWEANAQFVDEQLAPATEALLDAAAIGEGMKVLDLAAGPGGAGLAAAERVGEGGTVVLSDAAVEMVAVSARRATAHPQVSTAVFDQSEIVAADGSFDAAISRHGLMFVEDVPAAVREAARVLRPGGRYAAMTWGPREENPWLGLVLDAVGEQFGVPFPPANVLGPFSLDDASAFGGCPAGGRSGGRSGRGDRHSNASSFHRGLVGTGAEACGPARDGIGRYGAGGPGGNRSARARRRREGRAS